ncbi:MAG: hypothetical protein ACFB50_16455 [Rubrobacteraceae bacterium]
MTTQAEGGGLFSMMGTADAQIKGKGKKKTPPKTGTQPGKADGQKKKTYPKISVYYAGNTIDLPRSGMSAPEIHAFLEDDYRELAEKHSELIHDEERGLLIAYVKGQKKGASALSGKPLTVLREPPAESSPERRLFHVLADDGVYEARTTQAGTFAARVPSEVRARPGFALSVPKPPAAFLAEIVEGFKETPRIERLANVVYTCGSYEVRWPEQHGSAAMVEAMGTIETDETFIVVQLHSHGVLPAYFSEHADDVDEVRTGLYGVVGRCDEAVPDIVLRFSCGGLYGFTTAGEIFEESHPGELARIARDLRPGQSKTRPAGDARV